MARPACARLMRAVAALLVLLACTITGEAPRFRGSSPDRSRSTNDAHATASIHGNAFNTADGNSASPSVGSHFPESKLVLDMVLLSQAVYVLHRHKVQSCHDAESRSQTLLDSLNEELADARNESDSQDGSHDLFPTLLPEGTECLHYSIDNQVLIVRSTLRKYVAVVYAGTDDWKSTLTDGDILTSDLGPVKNETNGTRNNTQEGDDIFDGVPSGVRVHRGFNSAVFGDGFSAVMECVASARMGGSCDVDNNDADEGSAGGNTKLSASPAPYKIFTTGHSLGAADAVLLGAALHLRYPNEPLRSINFGCPKIGNTEFSYWMDSLQPEKIGSGNLGSFSIFRFVNKIDLVPRLPELEFTHAGHTLQMSVGGEIRAYYDHLGNEDLGYASVPYGWEAAPFALLPLALASHISKHYVKYLTVYEPNVTNSSLSNTLYYVRDFERVEPGNDPPTLIA